MKPKTIKPLIEKASEKAIETARANILDSIKLNLASVENYKHRYEELGEELKKRKLKKKKVFPDSTYHGDIFAALDTTPALGELIGGVFEYKYEDQREPLDLSMLDTLSLSGLTFYTKEEAEKMLNFMKTAAISAEVKKAFDDTNKHRVGGFMLSECECEGDTGE